MRSIDIGERRVGAGQPCYVIAEAGSNHDRDLGQARALIDVAAEAGADAVKFQSYTADRIAAQTSHPIAKYEWGGAHNLHELYAMTELPAEWLPELHAHAKGLGIEFLSTPFDTHYVDVLDELGVPAFKIASYELVDLPLIRHAARTGKPVLLSTGMGDLGEIEDAVQAMRAEGLEDFALLHCAISYPAPFDTVNLAAMRTMADAFGVPVGYSDHTTGITVPIAAVALGATIIEKHYTLSRGLPGPDHSFALEPDELGAMVRGIREAEASIGSSTKAPHEDELEFRARGRRSIFAAVDIAEGTEVSAEMLAVLRPGIGLAPKLLDAVVGRRARRDIAAHEPITWDLL
jgi:pseudaminic acid synthase